MVIAQILILTLWLGAAIFFAAVVAPAAFAALPSRELAGAVVGRVLPVLFVAGAGAGVIALLLETVERDAPQRRVRRPLRIVALCVIPIACAVAQLGVAPQIETLRAELSAPLASLPVDAPERVAFGRLHMISVAWLGAAMVAAGATVVLTAFTLRSGDAR